MSDIINANSCPTCSHVAKSSFSLIRHFRRAHGGDKATLYMALNSIDTWPTCACGCGERVNFFCKHGFGTYRRGHINRVRNSWGHNKDALAKSIAKRSKMWKDGTLRPWTLGLSKETDERIASLSKKCSEMIRANAVEIRKRSERMRKHRLDGTVPTLYGPDASQWKGGVNKVSLRCYANGRLYRMWKLPILRRAEFKCERCDNQKHLHIHHNDEHMAEIVLKFKTLFQYDESTCNEDMKQKVIDAIVDYHIDNSVSGVVLCKECHRKEHASLNF